MVFDFLRKLQRDPGRLEILGTGRQVRDLTYVKDTVSGLLVLASSGAPGEAYNIASGVSHTVTEVAECLLGLLQLRGQTELTYTGESWAGDAQRWEVDISRMRSLGHHPTVGLETGLQASMDWFEQRFGRLPRGRGVKG
jgi:nucleoside-diphosphate-sugar epimerase